jgi:hypothetical protein
MKLIITLSLLFQFFIQNNMAFATGGDEVRNGGGLAEGYLIFALKNLDQSIDICLSQSECALKNNGREILKTIKNSLNQEPKDILKFSSEKDKPGYFVIDGFTRLAVTGSSIGSPIYYNLDLLYKAGEVRLNYGQAVQSLIHELGHHNGIFNHDQLELIGADVRSALEGSTSDAAFFPYLANQGFFAFGTENKSFSKNGSLALFFRDQSVDLTSKFNALLENCDSNETSAEPLDSKALQFFNLHWDPSTLVSLSSEKVLSGNVVLYCRHKYLKNYRKFYEFKIGVKVNFSIFYGYKESRMIGAPKFLFKMLKNQIN